MINFTDNLLSKVPPLEHPPFFPLYVKKLDINLCLQQCHLLIPHKRMTKRKMRNNPTSFPFFSFWVGSPEQNAARYLCQPQVALVAAALHPRKCGCRPAILNFSHLKMLLVSCIVYTRWVQNLPIFCAQYASQSSWIIKVEPQQLEKCLYIHVHLNVTTTDGLDVCDFYPEMGELCKHGTAPCPSKINIFFFRQISR